MQDETMIFVDGENLWFRYQELIKAGKKPAPDNVIVEDCFVWNDRVLLDHFWNMKRLAYYTSVVGDDEHVKNVRRQIGAVTFQCKEDDGYMRTGQIVPFVHKKGRRSKKESVCDIAIAVDVMRACYRDHAGTIWVFSGDGDFIKLFHEVIHSGKRIYVSAFSSGLSEEVRYVVDEFIPLDDYFFGPPKAPAILSSPKKKS